MKDWKDTFFDGWPKEDGKYLVVANDIVNSWEEELNFIGGEWHMLCGNRFSAIVDKWCEI